MKIICRKIFTLPTEYSKQGGKSCTIPGQSFEISDLLARFERGERLKVAVHIPDEMDYIDPDTAPDVVPEFGDVPPVCQDITDVEEYSRSLSERKKVLQERFAKRANKKPDTPPTDELPADLTPKE